MMIDLHPDLDNWLKRATKNLAEPGKQIVFDEVLERYLDELDSARSEGASEAEAPAKVLASLGKPSVAARRFEDEYMTRVEACALSPLAGRKLGGPQSKKSNQPESTTGWRLRHSILLSISSAVVAILYVSPPTIPVGNTPVEQWIYFSLYVCWLGGLCLAACFLVLKPISYLQPLLFGRSISSRQLPGIVAFRVLEISVLLFLLNWIVTHSPEWIVGSGLGNHSLSDVSFAGVAISLCVNALWPFKTLQKKLERGPHPI